MKQLGFVCSWGEDRKKSWSGTNWGLYTALQKHYDIADIDTGEAHNKKPLLQRGMRKIRRVLKPDVPDMSLSRMRRLEGMVEEKIASADYPLFQFEELPMDYAGDQYIYLDLHAGFVKKMFDTDKETFALSAYQKVPQKYIYERARQQDRFFEHAAGIFTMGGWLQKELVVNYNIPSTKVHHVGGGINLNPDRIDDTRKEGNKILFVGRDYKRKGLPLVLEAFQLAKEQRNDIELFIAGPKKEKIDFDVPEGVTLLGDLSSDALVEYFNLCDIFCMPSVFEAYGLVFPEALTYGLPCIGRDAYEMPYFIEEGKTGYLLKENSAGELCGYILDLLQNEEIKKNVRDKREWYLKEYSWDAVAERIYAVIG